MSDTPRITHVYHWANGMTMVFDQHGKQMPEFQGVTDEMLPKLRAAGWPARRDVLDYYDDLTLQPWVREVAQPPSP